MEPKSERGQTSGQGQRDLERPKQAQPKTERDRGKQQTTGQGQRDQDKSKQQAQPKPDRDRTQQRTTGQGQRDQDKSKQQAQPKPDRDRGQQTTGQDRREQGKARQGQSKPERGTDQTIGQGREQQDREGRQDSTRGRQDGSTSAQDRQDTRTSARGRVDLSTEQRTRIRQSVFARSDVPRVDRVNFSVSVGTVVPPRVRVVSVPAEIVEIRPEFRGHQYFVVRDEIIIVDNARRIAAVIPVEAAGGGPAVRGGRNTQVVVDLSPDEIREVQRVLIDRGFSVEIDGRLGPRTQQALIQFQRQHGLQTTGRIDRRTVSELGVSVRSSGQGDDGRQPSTTGQGGADQDRAGQPSRSNEDLREPQRSPKGQQGDQQRRRGDVDRSEPPTTGESRGTTGQGQGRGAERGRGAEQDAPSNQGSGTGQGGMNDSGRKQAPSSGGAGGARGSMPDRQSK